MTTTAQNLRRSGIRRVVANLTALALLVAWILFPLTGEPLARIWRNVTTSEPQCVVCYRHAETAITYEVGGHGTRNVPFCSIHRQEAPRSFMGGRHSEEFSSTTFMWAVASAFGGIFVINKVHEKVSGRSLLTTPPR